MYSHSTHADVPLTPLTNVSATCGKERVTNSKNVCLGGYWLVNKEERFFYTHSARLCNTKPEKTRIALENTL